MWGGVVGGDPLACRQGAGMCARGRVSIRTAVFTNALAVCALARCHEATGMRCTHQDPKPL